MASLSKLHSIFLVILVGAGLSGCAVVNSTRQPNGAATAPRNGLSYYLPTGKVQITLTWNPEVRSWDVSPTVIYEPDVTARYNLDWTNNWCFDNDITISEDPATGLLETVNASSTDQSNNTAGTFIGTARNVYPLGTSIAAVNSPHPDGSETVAPGTISDAAPVDPYPTTLQLAIDPANPTSSVAYLASPSTDHGPRLFAAVRARLTKQYDLGNAYPKDKKLAIPADGKAKGIVVRIPIPYALEVEENLSSDARFPVTAKYRAARSIMPRTVMLPDATHDCILPIDKRPLVSDNIRIGLTNGMVQVIQQVRPSMIAAIMGVPRYLLTVVVPIPVEIKQNQQNVSTTQSKIETSEASAGTASEHK